MAIPRKTKPALLLSLLLLLICGVIYFLQLKQPPFRSFKVVATTKPVVITGEVVDAWCYASQTMGPGRGPGHRACALNCIHGGVSVGILEEKTNLLYIAAKYKGFKGCQELLLPYVGEKVKVSGWVGDLGGCRMLRIQTVEALTGPTVENLEKVQTEEPSSSAKKQKVDGSSSP